MLNNKESQNGMLIFLLLFITAVGQIAVDIYLPSMPSMQTALLASKDWVQLTLTVYTIGFGASQIAYGPLSDRFGRRNLLIIGMSLYTLATLGCVFSHSIEQLIFFRLLAGVGGGAASVLTRAVLRDSFTGIRMAQIAAYMSIAWSLVPIVAPVIGSYLQKWFNWQANFIFLFIMGLLVVFCVMKWLPDTNDDKRVDSLHPKLIAKRYYEVLTHSTAMRFALIPMLTFGCTISYATVSPFLIQTDLGYSPVTYGWLALLVSTFYLFANIINTRCVSRFGKMRMIRCGVFFNLLGGFSMFLFALFGTLNIYVIIIPACIIIFSGGFLFANAMTSAMIPFATTAGTAAAIIGGTQMLGGSIASAIVAQMPSVTQLPLSLLLLGMGCLLALVTFGLEEPAHDK